jgi:acetolactate synthase-1/2/3 large subunit
MLGMHGTYEANMTMHHSDVIFAVGVRFDDRTTNNLAKYCPNATVLHIDIDPTSISKTVSADVPIVGDARQVLEQMLELLARKAPSRWMRSATGGSRLNSGARVSA